MKIYILNGSPRKNGNTAQMCKAFADGAREAGAEVELVNLYDLEFSGCHSCFACKLKGGKHPCECTFPDAIRGLLHDVPRADGVVFASPIYFGTLSAKLHTFLERLFFQYTVYSKPFHTCAPKKLPVTLLYTMNVDEKIFLNAYIGPGNCGPVGYWENWIGMLFSKPERLCAFNTYQFDYDRYVSDLWDKAAKEKSRAERFPKDLAAARAAGARMAKGEGNS